MKRALAAAFLSAVAAPTAAHASDASLVARELPLGTARQLASAPARFDLVGLHWQGAGAVVFRTRSLEGRWSRWRPAAPEAEDGPDGGRERSRRGWRIGNPYWTGASDAIQYRTSGSVRRLRGYFVRSTGGAAPARTLAIAAAPPIVGRLAWNANESIRRAPPAYASSLELAIVHHTAGSSDYAPEESAAIVRAIQLYHVRGNGWNDIGYNFLVDKYGQVFEGRYGGVERNVVGAHAAGFNTGSVGVAVLGNYGARTLSAAARDALVRLLAWRLDVAHVDPASTLSFVSRGNGKFPAGVPVFLRAIVGHRDTGFTSCPGDRLYARLPEIASGVAATGLPKLYAPSVRGRLGGPVRFTARLSAALPWGVTVTDVAGATVASGAGTGAAVDWTWDATAAQAGPYAYAISAGPSVRPATGRLGAQAVLTLTRVHASPAVISPNGDGIDDSTTISYSLAAPATLTATLLDASGRQLATLFSEPKAAGDHTFLFTADAIPDGTYRIVLTAIDARGRQVTASAEVVVSRVLSSFAVSHRVFSPNGDGRLDTLRFTFALAEPASARLRILRDRRWVATPLAAALQPGTATVEWDGRKRLGRLLDGQYEAELTVTTPAATVTQRVGFAADTTPPTLTLISRHPLRLRVSEPADVAVTVGRRRTLVKRDRAGVFAVGAGRGRVHAVASDRAGNRSAPLRYR